MNNIGRWERKTKDGYTLYFDYYDNNGKRHQENSGLKLLNGKDPITKRINKETEKCFEEMRCLLMMDLMHDIHTPLTHAKQKIDFFEYYEKWMILNPSEQRRNSCALKKLRLYYGKDFLPITEVTENTLKGFKNFLENDRTGETAYGYFKALKKVLKQATKEKLFSVNPAADITLQKKSNAPKEKLTPEEVALLENTYCGNDDVKRAFLFSCYTGLRFCDISVLNWKAITEDYRVKIIQVKTLHPVNNILIPQAIELLGKREQDNNLIFNLPTAQATSKNLKLWMKRAGIEKHITYHCARHTFATQVYKGTLDLMATTIAMGQKDHSQTIRYLEIDNLIVDNAIKTLFKKTA